MKKSLLLKVVALGLEEARASVEAAAGLEFVVHESGYHGGGYFRGAIDGASLVLQENFIEDDGESTEAEFPDASYLLYVDGAEADVDRVSGRLNACRVLRASTY